jgi:hypothetical protein
MSKRTARRSGKERSTDAIRKRTRPRRRSRQPTEAAAAAERASAGMGTESREPTDWLFGDSLLSR